MATGEYQQALRSEGFISLPSGLQPHEIEPVFEQFRELYDLMYADDGSGKELYDAFRYEVPERPRDADYFQVRRRVGDINMFSQNGAIGTDDKDVAHIGPRTMLHARERLGKRMPKIMEQFIESCTEIHEQTKQAVRPVYRELGIEDIMLAKNPLDDIHMVRVLRYLGTEATHKADLHFDRSVATFAVWESSTGLVGAPGNNDYLHPTTVASVMKTVEQANNSPVNHVPGHGKFFLGAGYNHLPAEVREPQGELPLFAHGVVNSDPDQERSAVVVFMNPRLGYEPYTVASKHETDLNDLQTHLKTQAA